MANGNTERRFETAFKEVDKNEPGLIQEDDGTVWLVNPDGSRTELPGGGGNFDGGVINHTLTIDPTGADEPSLQIGESTEPPSDAAHSQLYTDPVDGLLKVKLEDGSVVVVGGGGGGGITDPLDILDCALWLDASTLELEDDDPVALWPDGSGNDFDAEQATAENQPVFKEDALNGLGVVRFVKDGDDYKSLTFSGGALGMLTDIPGLTVVGVLHNRSEDNLSEDVFWAHGPEDENGFVRRLLLTMSTGARWSYKGYVYDDTAGEGNSLQTPDMNLSSYIYSDTVAAYSFSFDFIRSQALFSFSEPPAVYYGNPVTPPFAAPATPSSSIGIGGDGLDYYSTYPLIDCDIAEIAVYQRALNALERRQVLEYLSAKWGTL